MVADSTLDLPCSNLSAELLVGLVLNPTLGWSWADLLAFAPPTFRFSGETNFPEIPTRRSSRAI